jgi:hypothetical protein
MSCSHYTGDGQGGLTCSACEYKTYLNNLARERAEERAEERAKEKSSRESSRNYHENNVNEDLMHISIRGWYAMCGKYFGRLSEYKEYCLCPENGYNDLLDKWKLINSKDRCEECFLLFCEYKKEREQSLKK